MAREQRRRHVLDCAKDVFAFRGYHSASVSDIIRAAGIARGTFYIYFKSKRDIFDRLLDEFFALIQANVKLIDASASAETSPIEQLRRNVDGVVGVLFGNLALSKILLSEAVGLDPEFDQKLIEFYSKLLGMIERSLDTGKRLGVVRRCDPRIVARCILGTVKEAMYQQVMGSFNADRERFVEELLRFNLKGVYSQAVDI